MLACLSVYLSSLSFLENNKFLCAKSNQTSYTYSPSVDHTCDCFWSQKVIGHGHSQMSVQCSAEVENVNEL